MKNGLKTIVIDDDPTGIQTVHGCLALTNWKDETIRKALSDDTDFFYILANTRACDDETARSRVGEAVQAVSRVRDKTSPQPIFVSRADSTLRGHFPLEVDTIKDALRRSGEEYHFDAVFFIPSFFEAGRYTRGDIHYLIEGGTEIPTSETEFARDSVFPYSNSWLPAYIEEKTNGNVLKEHVSSIPVELIRKRKKQGKESDGGLLKDMLDGLEGERYVVVNAKSYEDLDVFTAAAREALGRGKRFLFHTSSSFVKSFTENTTRSLLEPNELKGKGQSGLIVVGSHVPKTTRQLKSLLSDETTEGVEIDVQQCLDENKETGKYEEFGNGPNGQEKSSMEREVLNSVTRIMGRGKIPVLYTSRKELTFDSKAEQLKAGEVISAFLVSLVHSLVPELGFLISKGGITSHDILVEGLEAEYVRVLGQVYPGVPAVELPSDHAASGMPYVIFPGNVGEDDTLRLVYRRIFRP